MDKEQKQVIERLENIVYLYNRESRGWHDCNDIRLNSNDIKAIEKAIELVKAIPTDKDTITMTREEFSEKLMGHYRQGRADEKAYQNGEIMQSFNPE